MCRIKKRSNSVKRQGWVWYLQMTRLKTKWAHKEHSSSLVIGLYTHIHCNWNLTAHLQHGAIITRDAWFCCTSVLLHNCDNYSPAIIIFWKPMRWWSLIYDTTYSPVWQKKEKSPLGKLYTCVYSTCTHAVWRYTITGCYSTLVSPMERQLQWQDDSWSSAAGSRAVVTHGYGRAAAVVAFFAGRFIVLSITEGFRELSSPHKATNRNCACKKK